VNRPASRDNGGPRRDLIVATQHDVDPAHVIELVQSLSSGIEATPLVSSHPMFWTRLRSSTAVDRNEVVVRLEQAGIRVRYVACARHGTQRLANSLHLVNACPRRARDWKPRSAALREQQREPRAWSIGRQDVDADRPFCGSGEGTRLAVIDDDSAEVDDLDLDAEITICGAAPVRANHHAALVVGFSVGTRHRRGVAPLASPRLYVIPKPGQDIVSLPVAIVRAVDDGADVIVCATYIDDVAGPLLDDALELAACLGRGGRGTAVFFPTAHAESSGAAAMAAGVALLVLSQNPELTCSELDQLLTATALSASERALDSPLADAKHGHGRLTARRACLGASDPIAAALVRMGSDGPAACFAELRARDATVARAYSSELARWGARALLADPSLSHALSTMLRHARLICHDPARSGAQPEGGLLRQITLVLRMAHGSSRAPRPSEAVSTELTRLLCALLELSAEPDGALAWESAVYLKFSRLWAMADSSSELTAAE